MFLSKIPAASTSEARSFSQVAAELAHRSFAGPIGCVFATAILLFATPLYRDHPVAAVLYACIMLTRVVTRAILTLRRPKPHAGPPAFSGWLVASSVYSLSLPTGLLAFVVIHGYGFESWSTLVLIAFIVALAVSGTTAIAPDRRLAIGFELTLLLPIIAASLSAGGSRGNAMAAATAVFIVYVILHVIRQNDDYWKAIAKDEALRNRAEELHAARTAADAASAAKSQFLANMSHEIRTPMNGVLGMLELVMQSELSREQRENLGYARESAQSLLGLLNDILDHSKAEAGRLEFEQIDFSLERVMLLALTPYFADAQQKGIAVTYELSERVPGTVCGDKTRLRQVIVNLVSNAMKFTRSGSIRVEVDVDEFGDSTLLLHFSVSDTGPGVPLAQQKAIFEAFSQGDSSITRRFGGTGLGLTICRELVSLMGGRIWLVSEPGHGATFHFTARLGRSKAPLPAEAPVDPHPELLDTPPLYILVAEDNLINQRVLSQLLAKSKHRCKLAGTGEQAITYVSREQFDLILMDVHMPELDGIEATRRIRESEAASGGHIPIFGVTASAGKSDVQACLDSGMDGCISKPIEVPELKAVLDRVAAGQFPLASISPAATAQERA